MCGLLWTTLIGFCEAPASFSSLSCAAVKLPMLYLLSHHQTAGLLFSTVYTQDGGESTDATSSARPLHVMYNHCPCVARQPQPPWPLCVICVLWCSWHRHLTRILAQNLAKIQAVLHMDLNLLDFFSCVVGRKGSAWVKGMNHYLLHLKKAKHWLNTGDWGIVTVSVARFEHSDGGKAQQL